jgi:hypothetical protein
MSEFAGKAFGMILGSILILFIFGLVGKVFFTDGTSGMSLFTEWITSTLHR